MPTRRRTALPLWSACVLAFIAAWLAGPAHAQSTPAGQTVFRTSTQEVLVDAVVTDKNGNFQPNLTREDFKIFEDGKEQPITSFALGGEASRRSSKHFIAFVVELEYPELRDQIIQFVDRFASPDLYMAVFSRFNGNMRMQQAFTTDAVRIRAAIRTLQVMPPDPSPLDINGVPGKRLSYFDRLSRVVAAIAPVRGQKALVLFTFGNPGWLMDRDYLAKHSGMRANEVQKAIDECNAAGVSVYSFAGPHLGGYLGNRSVVLNAAMAEVAPDGRPYATPIGSGDFVRDLSEFTGGKYTPPGTYDVASYLAGMMAAQNDYYLLGYTPTGESAEKPCHRLKVKVAGRSLQVEARDSYCSNVPVSHALTSPQRALEARAISGAPSTIQGGLQVSWFYSRPNTAVVDIAMDLDPAVFRLHGLHGEFNLSGAAYRPDGSVAARIGDTVRVNFETRAEMDTFLKSPFHYSNQLDLSPGQYRLRIAFGFGEQAFGSAERPIEINPWDGKTLSTSATALAVQDYPLTDATADLDNSLLEGPRRLVSKRRQVIPMGGITFPSGKSGLIYFEIYDPELSQALASQPVESPVVRIRIVNRATTNEVDSSITDTAPWIRPGDQVIPIALPLTELPPGGYTLEVEVSRANRQDTVIRHVDFDVK